MKNIKIRCCCEAIFEKEVIINDKNMSEKQLKEIIEEAKNNFIDEVETDLYYIGNKLQPYETIKSEVKTIYNYEHGNKYQ